MKADGVKSCGPSFVASGDEGHIFSYICSASSGKAGHGRGKENLYLSHTFSPLPLLGSSEVALKRLYEDSHPAFPL